MAEYQVSTGIDDADNRYSPETWAYITLQVFQDPTGWPDPSTVSVAHTLDTMLEFSRSQDDSWLRDRAVVFGDGVVAEASAGDSPTKTVALSTPFITSEEAAESLAARILSFFDETLDIKRCLIEGDETIWLAEMAAIIDSWTGLNAVGMITSIETTVDDRGFRQLVSLDEKCGFIWGWGGIRQDDADNRYSATTWVYATLQVGTGTSDADSR